MKKQGFDYQIPETCSIYDYGLAFHISLFCDVSCLCYSSVRNHLSSHICTFCQILKAMGLVKTASSALNLLIDIGYFPVHVNLDLLKFNIHMHHSDEVISAAESLLSDPTDPDEVSCFLLGMLCSWGLILVFRLLILPV